MSGEVEIPDGLVAYTKALQSNRKIAEPISDDELQRLRKAVDPFDSALNDWRHNCGKEQLTPTPLSQSEWHLLHEAKKCNGLPELLARLDAAESRVAELQREVERLQRNVESLTNAMSNAIITLTMRNQGDQVIVNFERVLSEVIKPC